MASETVIAHNVITSGQSPKNMGWVDEAYRDSGERVRKGRRRDAHHRRPELGRFRNARDRRGLSQARRLPPRGIPGHQIHHGRREVVRRGVRDGRQRGHRRPTVQQAHQRHIGLPERLSEPERRRRRHKRAMARTRRQERAHVHPTARSSDPTLCGRFFINSDSNNDYGTKAAFPSFMYPEDGNRFFPGTDASAQAGHLGGDTWVADAAIEMMGTENWSGMFITLGAIDKSAHMWGADADVAPSSCTTGAQQTHVKCAAENADVQLGKLLTTIAAVDAAKGGETLVVLTADHGATYGANFYGKPTSAARVTRTGTTRRTAFGTPGRERPRSTRPRTTTRRRHSRRSGRRTTSPSSMDRPPSRPG